MLLGPAVPLIYYGRSRETEKSCISVSINRQYGKSIVIQKVADHFKYGDEGA